MSGRHPPAGWALANTEKYDGSSWTNSTASPTALNQVTTTGTQTAALLWGGVPSPGAAHVSTTFEFDGSSWTSGGGTYLRLLKGCRSFWNSNRCYVCR